MGGPCWGNSRLCRGDVPQGSKPVSEGLYLVNGTVNGSVHSLRKESANTSPFQASFSSRTFTTDTSQTLPAYGTINGQEHSRRWSL